MMRRFLIAGILSFALMVWFYSSVQKAVAMRTLVTEQPE